ncbi:hypothetical protein KSP40_PGU017712 [Platanthera guangdongensis]|uniref:Uncharacterized protein n=1 Tax=Platanthera guangdongensis TaxID=2320717 RepID=A0ABR2LM10_9ASPA
MTGDAKQAAKEEPADDLDGPISGLSRKPLKKEELIPKDERDDDNTPLTLYKSHKKRPSISPKVEKQEPEDDEDENPLKKKKVLKKNSKPKSVKKELDFKEEEEEEDGKLSKKSRKRKRVEKKKAAVKVKKESVSREKIKSDKKEKKQYQLPGQKHEKPEMRDPLRIFYESLYEKVPTSEMAAQWLMERGLLSREEAETVYAKKLRKHHIQKFGSPGKVTPVKKSSTTSVKKKVKVASKATAKRTKKKLGNSEAGEDDSGNQKTTPAKKSSAVSVKKEVKVTSKTAAKKSKNLSDSEAEADEDDDDDFVETKKKSGNRKKASA